MHLRRTFLPAVGAAEGGAALERVLLRRGCRLDGIEAGADIAVPEPETRLFASGAIAQGGVAVAWLLDETAAEPDLWDPLLARELSAELGGFAVSIEASRSLGRSGWAVFFAGRTIEFVSENRGEAPLALGSARDRDRADPVGKDIHAEFGDLYTQLTGWPCPAEEGMASHLSIVATGCPPPPGWRPRATEEKPLALAVFPLVDEAQFAAVWQAVATADAATWRRRPVFTAPAGIPYVVLSRDGDPDVALYEALARRLDVPAAAVGLAGPGATFASWRVQPGEAAQRGSGGGAAALVACLMPALSALGERPGILHIG